MLKTLINAEVLRQEKYVADATVHWQALSVAGRAAIREAIYATYPFKPGKTFDNSHLFRQCCIREMRKRFPEIDRALRPTLTLFTAEGGFVPPLETPPLQELGDLDQLLRRINQGSVN